MWIRSQRKFGLLMRRACPLLSRGMATFSTAASFYDIKDVTASGEELAFSAFRGKVVYVQNVASR